MQRAVFKVIQNGNNGNENENGNGNIDTHTNTTQDSTYDPPQTNTALNTSYGNTSLYWNYGVSVNEVPSLTGCNSFGERVIYLRSNLSTLKEKVENYFYFYSYFGESNKYNENYNIK